MTVKKVRQLQRDGNEDDRRMTVKKVVGQLQIDYQCHEAVGLFHKIQKRNLLTQGFFFFSFFLFV